MNDRIHKPKKEGLIVTRLLKGDKSVRRLAEFGYTLGIVPEDGYLISANTYFGGAFYLRDSALAEARRAREKNGTMTAVEVRGWE